MKTVIIIQARTTSNRLPGKVLMDIAGKPMLAHELERLKRCKMANEIVVATTSNSTDDPIAELAQREGVKCFRGSEFDVLGRFVGAARQVQAEAIVRVTADCPIIDPEVTDRVISELLDHQAVCDYASNVQTRTYPRGLDVESFFFDTLLRFDRLGRSQTDREHVTTVLRLGFPGFFLCRSVEDNQNNADLRWTVDTEADLHVVRTLFEAMDMGEHSVSYRDVVEYARTHPELTALNSGIATWDPYQSVGSPGESAT